MLTSDEKIQKLKSLLSRLDRSSIQKDDFLFLESILEDLMHYDNIFLQDQINQMNF